MAMAQQHQEAMVAAAAGMGSTGMEQQQRRPWTEGTFFLEASVREMGGSHRSICLFRSQIWRRNTYLLRCQISQC